MTDYFHSKEYFDFLSRLSKEEQRKLGYGSFTLTYKNGKWVVKEEEEEKKKNIADIFELKGVEIKKWYNLKECCELKGVNYKTACNKAWLRPNCGIEDGIISGRKCWKIETVLEWLVQDDRVLKEMYRKRKKQL